MKDRAAVFFSRSLEEKVSKKKRAKKEREKTTEEENINSLEAGHRRKLRVHVQGVFVPREAVESRGGVRQTLLEGVVGRARGRGVGCRRRRRTRSQRPLLLAPAAAAASEPPRPSHKHRQLLVAQQRLFPSPVPRRGREDDHGRLALVADGDDARLRLHLRGGGQGARDGDELLAVEDSQLVVVVVVGVVCRLVEGGERAREQRKLKGTFLPERGQNKIKLTGLKLGRISSNGTAAVTPK